MQPKHRQGASDRCCPTGLMDDRRFRAAAKFMRSFHTTITFRIEPLYRSEISNFSFIASHPEREADDEGLSESFNGAIS
jgi:hypothetical protein